MTANLRQSRAASGTSSAGVRRPHISRSGACSANCSAWPGRSPASDSRPTRRRQTTPSSSPAGLGRYGVRILTTCRLRDRSPPHLRQQLNLTGGILAVGRRHPPRPRRDLMRQGDPAERALLLDVLPPSLTSRLRYAARDAAVLDAFRSRRGRAADAGRAAHSARAGAISGKRLGDRAGVSASTVGRSFAGSPATASAGEGGEPIGPRQLLRIRDGAGGNVANRCGCDIRPGLTL